MMIQSGGAVLVSGQIPDALEPIRSMFALLLSPQWLWVVRGVFIAGLLLCVILFLYYRRRKQS